MTLDRIPPRWRKKIELSPGGCWLWTGGQNRNGYGRAQIDGVMVMLHIWMYRTFVGPTTPGLVLDHTCRVRRCCNPFHLEEVTVKVNTDRGDGVLFQFKRKDPGVAMAAAIPQ